MRLSLSLGLSLSLSLSLSLGLEKGLYSPEALMTAAGLLLGSCAGLLAARRLCA
eukprot:COSAG01_NODE_57835_length_309_cov_3.580952_1_plen_53_part_01